MNFIDTTTGESFEMAVPHTCMVDEVLAQVVANFDVPASHTVVLELVRRLSSGSRVLAAQTTDTVLVRFERQA